VKVKVILTIIIPPTQDNITMMPGRSEESLRRYAERVGVPPGDVGRVVLGGTDNYDVPLMTRFAELYNVVLYAFGLCQRPFISRVVPIEVCAQLFTAATGIRVTAEDLLFKAERIITLQRLFNLRQGLTTADDMFPQGYLSEGELKEFAPMLQKYYEAHGWDGKTGIPTPERLAQLGLAEWGRAVFYQP
jgi:aldehyde:ferredoxin oxidoreductase